MSSNNQLGPWLHVPWPHGLPPVAGCQTTRPGYMVACRHSSMKAAVRCCCGDGGVTPVMHQWWHGTPRWVVLQRDKSEGDAVTVMLELLGQAHKKSLIISKAHSCMVGGNSFVPPCYWRWRESSLKGGFLSMHLQVCGGGEKGRNTCGPGRAWHGEVRPDKVMGTST
jgi:hypothetical protein